MKIVKFAVAHFKKHIGILLAGYLIMLVHVIILFPWVSGIAASEVSSPAVKDVKLAEVVQINIKEVYADKEISIVPKEEVKRWLRYVTVSKSSLSEAQYLGTLTISLIEKHKGTG